MRGDARKRLHGETDVPEWTARPGRMWAFRGDVLVVGLIGKKRAGKDTFAAPLVEKRGFERLAFADPLKEAALGLDPLIRFEGDEGYLSDLGAFDRWHERLSSVVARLGWEKAKEIREVRRTLQNYGVAIREIDPTFWVRGVTDKIAKAPGGSKFVITDVRFPNEAEAITALGGSIVRIVRPGLVSDDTHASETALDGYPEDLLVENAGTPESLAETALHLLF